MADIDADKAVIRGMLGMLSPESGQFCENVQKHSVFEGFWRVQTWKIWKTAKQASLNGPGRIRFLVGFSVNRRKNTVFSIVLYGFKAGRKRGKCGNLLSRQGSPLPDRTRFLAAFLANQ